jgi:hypothetical protein
VREGQIFFVFLPSSSSFFFFCFFTCVTNGKNRADMVGTMVDPGGRHNSAVHGIAGGASSTPSLSALLVPSDHRSVQLLPYPWWKDGLTTNNSTAAAATPPSLGSSQNSKKEIQFLVSPYPLPKKKKKKRVGALSTLNATFTSSLSLSLDAHNTQFTCSGNQNNTAQFNCSTNQHNTNNATQFTLLWKPNTKNHTHTQQHNNTQKQKSLKKRATIPNLQTQKKMFCLTLTFNPPPPPPPPP